jgi:hypothetical protein
MSRWLQTKLHPAWYQGHRATPPYFEGWYFKLVDATERHRYAVIPGVFRGKDDGHAFVQVLDGVTGQVDYYQYPMEAFWAEKDVFDVHVGPNRFTEEQITLALESPEQTLVGELHFSSLTPWPVTLPSPGIMGWYAWVPRMECYHGVLSLDHEISGALTINGQTVDFGAGRGYIEKDWGRSFPAAWVWLQTNHFEEPGTSLTASVAVIPWLGSTFRGFIIGLWHEGRLYRFATYTGAQVAKLAVNETRANWVVRDRQYRLEIDANRDSGIWTGVLRGPTGLDMGGRVPESLQATVGVRLVRLADGRMHFSGTGRCAGLEIVEPRRLVPDDN